MTSGPDNEPWSELRKGLPVCWVRDGDPLDTPDALGTDAVMQAGDRWRRFAPVLATLLDTPTQGQIDSPLLAVPHLVTQHARAGAPPDLAERVFVKADHALPLAGSIKARGGVYAVLCVAERIALKSGLLEGAKDYSALLQGAARRCFAAHQLVVGSTGNLGFAVGVIGRALGFTTIVHMSQDAKDWKKHRLRALGVTVVEHAADYTSAVTAARDAAAALPNAHFIDDERSPDLFFGYSAVAPALMGQLQAYGIHIDADHPLCIYLPCGVGGAPAGVLFGLRALLGPHVWGFLAEPTASPCMLMRLMGAPASASVYDVGLDNRTIADGLAVARASDFAFEAMGEQIMGAYTVTDPDMLAWVAAAASEAKLRLEPSAATGFPGALVHVWQSPVYERLRERLARATHIVWTTGGAMLPDAVYQQLLADAASGRAA